MILLVLSEIILIVNPFDKFPECGKGAMIALMKILEAFVSPIEYVADEKWSKWKYGF